MDPTIRVWREIIIWKLVSSLPMNLVTPGIPVYNLWFNINNSQSKLFNNPNMLSRHTSTPDENRFKQTDLSDISIAIICESTGSTINNTLIFHESEEYLKKNQDLFTSPIHFMKYIFEITYTLYCLNTRIGVIHIDLHLNNTTMNSLYQPYFDYELDILNVKPAENDVIIYHVGDELYYSFPHIIKYATVIDFSRSIVKPESIKDHLKAKHMYKKFVLNQTDIILKWYSRYMPDLFAEFQTEIKNACNTNFNMVFKLISAIDMYFHSVLLLKFFDKHTHITKHKSVDTIKKDHCYYAPLS